MPCGMSAARNRQKQFKHLLYKQHPSFLVPNWLKRYGCYWHKPLFLRSNRKHLKLQKQRQERTPRKRREQSRSHILLLCSRTFLTRRGTKSLKHIRVVFPGGKFAPIFGGATRNTQPL